MRNILCKASLVLATTAMLLCMNPLYAETEATPHQLESALMKYILTYEAYLDAKQSDNIEVRKDLAKYVKAYRESYAQYLALLHDSDLYEPTKKSNDPAGHFNKKQREKGRDPQLWAAVNCKEERERIKQLIKEGKSIDEIMQAVEQELPATTLSSTPEESEGFSWTNNQGNNPSGVYGGNNSSTTGEGCGSNNNNGTFSDPGWYGYDDDDDEDGKRGNNGNGNKGNGNKGWPEPPRGNGNNRGNNGNPYWQGNWGR